MFVIHIFLWITFWIMSKKDNLQLIADLCRRISSLPTDHFTERRRAARRRVLLGAKIAFGDGHYPMGCQIVGLSETGATLQPWDAPLCPDEFDLVAHSETVRKCRVAWRRGELLGVRYV
jgi:hypothetical protein